MLTRNSSADEIANMNFFTLRPHRTRTTKCNKEEKKHTVKQSLNSPQ